MNEKREKIIRELYKIGKRENSMLHYSLLGDVLDELDKVRAELRRYKDKHEHIDR